MLILAVITAIAARTQQPAWTEMDASHQVIGAVFHPAEENDLGPTWEKAGDLYDLK